MRAAPLTALFCKIGDIIFINIMVLLMLTVNFFWHSVIHEFLLNFGRISVEFL